MILGCESDVIAYYFAPFADKKGAFDFQDDAALYTVSENHELLLTTDALVENVHYFPDTLPDDIAYKLFAVNLSDVAAKGAIPQSCLLTFGPNKNISSQWIKQFASETGKQLEQYNMSLLGGDTITVPQGAFFSLTILAEVPNKEMIKRKGAKKGDDIYVSGTIGHGFIGLHHRHNDVYRQWKKRFIRPIPRVTLGQSLRGIAHAATDISDGLVMDLTHICIASQCGMQVDIEKIPFAEGGWENKKQLMTGGDDYEIIFTASVDKRRDIARYAIQENTPLTRIGHVTEGNDIQFLLNGLEYHIEGPAGYCHFSAFYMRFA